MPTEAIVIYTMNLAGDLAAKLPQLANSLGKAATKAAELGAAAQATASRSLVNLRTGINDIGEQSQRAAEGTAKILGGLTALTIGIGIVLRKNDEFEQSFQRTKNTLDDTAESFADAFGPGAAKWLDNVGLGLTYVVGLMKALPEMATVVGETLGNIDVKRMMIAEMFGDKKAKDALMADAVAKSADAVKALDKALNDATASAKEYYDSIHDGVNDSREVLKKSAEEAAKYREALIKAAGVSGRGTAGGQHGGGFDPRSLDALVDLTKALDATSAELGTMATDIAAAMAPIMASAGTTQAASVVGSIDGALRGGLAGVLSTAGGPIGAIVAEVIGLVHNLPGLLKGVFDEILFVFFDLPDVVYRVLGKIAPKMIEMVPQITAAFVTLVPELLMVAIQALAPLTAATVSMILAFLPTFVDEMRRVFLELPALMGQAFVDAWKSIKDDFGNAFGKGGAIQTSLGSEANVKKILGVKIPFLADGGMVERSGLVFAHAGERYGGVQDQRKAGSTVNSSVNFGSIVVVANDPRQFAQQLRQLRGPYGVGIDLGRLA